MFLKAFGIQNFGIEFGGLGVALQNRLNEKNLFGIYFALMSRGT
jgi:hypothetical protein